MKCEGHGDMEFLAGAGHAQVHDGLRSNPTTEGKTVGFFRNLFSSAPPAPPKAITQKDIKKLFVAIRNDEFQAVKDLIAANPAFANVCAFAPPKKDDGQS